MSVEDVRERARRVRAGAVESLATSATLLADGHPYGRVWDSMRDRVDGWMVAAGLVALDHALVRAVRDAGDCDCCPREGEAPCNACAAKIALADSVLAQVSR